MVTTIATEPCSNDQMQAATGFDVSEGALKYESDVRKTKPGAVSVRFSRNKGVN